MPGLPFARLVGGGRLCWRLLRHRIEARLLLLPTADHTGRRKTKFGLEIVKWAVSPYLTPDFCRLRTVGYEHTKYERSYISPSYPCFQDSARNEDGANSFLISALRNFLFQSKSLVKNDPVSISLLFLTVP